MYEIPRKLVVRRSVDVGIKQHSFFEGFQRFWIISLVRFCLHLDKNLTPEITNRNIIRNHNKLITRGSRMKHQERKCDFHQPNRKPPQQTNNSQQVII